MPTGPRPGWAGLVIPLSDEEPGPQGQVVADSVGLNPRPLGQVGPLSVLCPLFSCWVLQGRVQAPHGEARPAEAKVGRARALGARLCLTQVKGACPVVPLRLGRLRVGLVDSGWPRGSEDPRCLVWLTWLPALRPPLVTARPGPSSLAHTHPPAHGGGSYGS